jgi:peptidoglycan hydrolase-like protein with peptidoglycan-binding domain
MGWRLFLCVAFCLFLGGCATAGRRNSLSQDVLTAQNSDADSLAESALGETEAPGLGAEPKDADSNKVTKKKNPASLTKSDIQAALKNAGFYAGPIDGKLGPLSRKAIKEFQQANGLEADGIAGQKTKALLVKYL